MDPQVSDGDSHAIAFQVDAKGVTALLFDGGWETFPLASALEAMKHYHETIGRSEPLNRAVLYAAPRRQGDSLAPMV